MKRMVSVLCGIAVLLSCTGLRAFAETPVPADIDPVVYEKILSTGQYADPNMDGIMTEEELRKTDRLSIDMEGVSDLSWLQYMESCKLIQFRGGTITDYSPVKDLPALKTLQMYSVPATDISFAKDMDLDEFRIIDMPQITLAQRLEIAQWQEDLTVEQGFSEIFRLKPSGLLGDPLKCSMEIEDLSVARVLNGFHSSLFDGGNVFAVAPGTTSYRLLTADGEEAYRGTITVTANEPYDPPVGEGECTAESYGSYYYDTKGVVLRDGTLYGFSTGEPEILEEHVKAYASDYRYTSTRGIYQHFDAVVKEDGTLLLNKKVVPGMDCADIQNECVITRSGELYGIYPVGREIGLVKIADDFKEFYYTADAFYINQNGEVIGYEIDLLDDNQPSVKLFPTGIMNPVSMHYNLFVDENHVLWHPAVRYGELSISQIAENVKEVGYYPTGEYYLEEYLYLSEDGTYHAVYGDDTGLTPVPDNPARYGFLKMNSYSVSAYKDEAAGDDGSVVYILNPDHTLTLNRNGAHAAITHVEKIMTIRYDKTLGEGYVYFFRTDGSIWRYCFERKAFEEIMPPQQAAETVPGDVSGDGTFGVTDLICFQKWLLAMPDAELTNWKAADLYADGRLDILDLAVMKHALLREKTT